MDISQISWIVVVLVSAVLGTLSGFLDNYTADVLFGGKHAQAVKMIFGPLYLIMGIVILLIIRPSFQSAWPLIALLGGGVASSLGSIPYYAGLEREETTGSKIFSQLIPIFSLILAWIFLGQAIAGWQWLAFAAVLAAPLIIIFAKRKKNEKLSLKSAGYFILYDLCVAVSSLFFVSGSGGMPEQSFWVWLAVFLCGKGSTDLMIMATRRKWRRHFYRRLRKTGWRMFAVVGLNFAVWQTADLLYRFATVDSDSVALVAATYEAVVLIGTFFLGVVLSLLWPVFGREKLDRRTVLAHLFATGVALVGIILMG